jgi:carboxymethylenebutenolidase
MREYLSSEVVVDYADGIISRREAVRRLGLLGVGAALAGSMLAACVRSAEAPKPAASGSAPPGPAPRATEAITFHGSAGQALRGAWATAESARGAVLVIHENKGLTDHIRSVAGRLAASGYSALAIDLLSEEGGTGTFTDPAGATAALGKVPPGRFVADMKAGIGELRRRTPGAKLGAVGFCFGGGMVWSLLAAGEPRLAAAVPFYGPLPEGADFSGSPNAAVLAIYAELDQRVGATRGAATAALTKAGLVHEVVTEPGADHAFFNDTGPRYNAKAAVDAYRRLLAWFAAHLR